MKLLSTFFGQVLRKGDVDFISNGYREGVTRMNVDLTAGQGGVISGLDVFQSLDNLSVLITPGVFYSFGPFNSTNNQGGGERAQVYTTQSFTGLPSTPPIANQPSYLVVYVKIANQNNNPDPTQLQTTTTSINIQTGQNIPTQNYPVGTIAISNPILLNQVGTINGVPLALLQVDYIGTTQISSNGTIQSIDSSIKSDYVIGGAVDVAEQVILEQAIPNGFITNRMIGSGQITGYNFATGTINSAAIAPWDGSANVVYSGDGIATGHLKSGAVTQSTINYISGLNDFSERNFVVNSSFEEAQTQILSWNFTGTTAVTSASVISNASLAQFGNNAVLLQGGSTGSPAVSATLSLSQNINFAEPIGGENLTAYFYTQLASNLAGSDFIGGTVTFYANMTNATAGLNSLGSQTFGVLTSGNSFANGSYVQCQTSSPIVVPANTTVVNIAIGGQFSNPVIYIDGVFVGLTSITPKFSVALEEQLNQTINASNITYGTLNGQLLAQGSVTPNMIPLANGGVYSATNGGIVGPQIANQTITAANIANNTITSSQLAAGIIQTVPKGAILMFVPDAATIATNNAPGVNPGQNGCPQGMSYYAGLEAAMPVGGFYSAATNPVPYSQFTTPGNLFGSRMIANSTTQALVGTQGHAHSIPESGTPGRPVGGSGFNAPYNTASATDTIQLPFVVVLWCIQN